MKKTIETNNSDIKNIEENKTPEQESSDNQDEKVKKEAEQEDLYKEDSLALVGLTLKERIAYHKELYNKRTANMEKKEKFIYTIGYYKWFFIAFLALLVCLAWTGKTIYKASFPQALRVAIINDLNDTATNYIPQTFRDYYGLDEKNRVTVYTNLIMAPEDTEKMDTMMTPYQTIGYYNTTDMIDVIIGNETALEIYASSDDTTAIDLSMDADLYEQIEEYVVTLSDPKGIKNDGQPYAAAIDISDTEFAKGCGLSYDEVYLMIPSTKFTNNERTINLIKLIFDL